MKRLTKLIAVGLVLAMLGVIGQNAYDKRPPKVGDIVRIHGRSGEWRLSEHHEDNGTYLIVSPGKRGWPMDIIEKDDIAELVRREEHPRQDAIRAVQKN